MKDHVRGPISCCETIAKDVLLMERAESLQHHPGFGAVKVHEHDRGKEDNLGGDSNIRLIGSPVFHTSIDVLRAMLEEVLSDYPELYEEGWEPDDYAREDIVMTEYRQARIGTSTSFTVDWNSGHKQTSDYFMY